MSVVQTNLIADTEEKVRILLVDDRLDSLFALETALSPLNQILVTAQSGKQALKYLLEDDYAVILLDVRMPDIDGYETATLIRQRDRSKHIPIIFVTGTQASEAQVFKGYEMGAVDYILKPLDQRVLRSKVSVFVDLAKKNALLGRQAEQLKASEAWYRAMVDNGPAVTYVRSVNEAFMAEYVSPNVTRLLGWTADVFKNDTHFWVNQIHPEDVPRLLQQWESFLQKGHQAQEYRFRHKDGNYHWLYDGATLLFNDKGHPDRIVGFWLDITEKKNAVDKHIKYLAHHDSLTSLPNRVLLKDRLEQALTRAHRTGQLTGLMYLDVDHFKDVNDSLGHDAGDHLLVTTSRRLQHCVRKEDTVARVGGDEFVVVLPDIQDISDIAHIAQKTLDAMAEPIVIENRDIRVTSSIGVAVFPFDGEEASTLFKNADTALYYAKEAGRNRYQFYTREMTENALKALALENNLRRALEREEFSLYYQPQIDIRTGQIVGAEALIRWHHPERGLIMPGHFIRLAEDRGLIVPISDWVMHAACTECCRWQNAGLPPIRVAVNLSSLQFRENKFLEKIEKTLMHTRLPPSFLELEVTESVVMSDIERVIPALNMLRERGIKLAIDDFGTGYSSLTYLQRLPIEKLKIDQSFVQNLAHNETDTAIMAAIITLAKTLGLKVIAEGVETEKQKDLLDTFNCDQIQGNYYYHPLPADEFFQLLQAQQSLTIEPAKVSVSRH